VEIIFRGKNEIYISKSIREAERLITTDISAPVEGMDLRIEEMTNPLHEPLKDERGRSNG
jgi:hypothetical protein